MEPTCVEELWSSTKLLDETTNQWKFTFSLAFGTLSGTATGDCAGTCSDNEDTTDEEDDGDGGRLYAVVVALEKCFSETRLLAKSTYCTYLVCKPADMRD
jgi:hypothetical protein